LAFNKETPAPIRIVDLPNQQAEDLISTGLPGDTSALLEMIFMYGQNDFQPQRIRSVSVGDVAVLPDGRKFRVLCAGWEILPVDTDINKLERGLSASLL